MRSTNTARRKATAPIDGRQTGAFDVDTEVPTPQGMATIGTLEPGQSVFGSDGRPVTVVEVSEPFEPPVCIEVEFATGERMVVDHEQRLLTERRDLPRSVSAPTRRASAEIAAGVASLGPAVYAVRVAPPVQLPRRKLPIDPYLFGVWLGSGVPHQAAILGADDELVRHLTDAGARVFTSGFEGQHWLSVGGGLRRGADLTSLLRELGVLDDKHVPMPYLRASEEQRADLLAGLLDASGVVADGGEIVFRSPSAGVAVGVHQLLTSLGYRPWFRPGGGVVDIGFVTGAHVFRSETLQAQANGRRRLNADVRPRRLVVAADAVSPRPVRRVRVGSDDGVLLVGRSFIPVPGSTFERAEQLSSPA